MTKIENYLNSLPYHFYFLVVDDFLDINLPNLSNFASITPKSLGIELEQKNSGKLLSHPECINFIKTHTPNGQTPAVIPFKPSAKIDLICSQNGWVNISNPGKLNRFLEDKIEFSKLLDEHSLPQIPHTITTFSKSNFEVAQNKYGPKLVIQTHFGWAGNSSHLTDSFEEVTTKIAEGTPVKISPFLVGTSLINNCCLTSQGLVQSPPGLQYTGIPVLSKNPLATTGRQWPSHSSPEVNDQVKKITSDFSEILKTHGYKGFFGLDFFVSENKVYLLECNPRLTASFAFYTAIEKNSDYEPLFFYHLLSFFPNQYRINPVEQNRRFSDYGLVGSEITLKGEEGNTIKKYNALIDFAPEGDPTKIDPKILSEVVNEVI
ncbi:MAG: ATP-grasp domain-containing protein [Candidatus Shapirobacteria bacterium]|jgi:hypothetical protein